jgi:hypothetical protein
MLPYVDEHHVETHSSPDAVWEALWVVLRKRFGGSRGSRLFARAVGVREREPIVGFRVAEEERGRLLVLEGSHRFARYRLAFELDAGRLKATTHAAFPGPHGRIYRTLILPTGFHARVVRRILASVVRRAEAQHAILGQSSRPL